MIVTIYSNIAIFVQVFVGYSIYCDIPTNNHSFSLLLVSSLFYTANPKKFYLLYNIAHM